MTKLRLPDHSEHCAGQNPMVNYCDCGVIKQQREAAAPPADPHIKVSDKVTLHPIPGTRGDGWTTDKPNAGQAAPPLLCKNCHQPIENVVIDSEWVHRDRGFPTGVYCTDNDTYDGPFAEPEPEAERPADDPPREKLGE